MKLAAVSIFLQVYEDAEPVEELDRLICQWRFFEERTRRACNLAPISTDYPGCFPITREASVKLRGRNLGRMKPRTAVDVITRNWENQQWNVSHQNKLIHMDEENWSSAEEKDWDEWIHSESMKQSTPTERRLVNYEHLEFFNYWLMLKVRTEYYFRYEGVSRRHIDEFFIYTSLSMFLTVLCLFS